MKLPEIRKVPLLVSSASALVIFLFVFFGPPGLYELSSSPEFCNTCHVMNDQYEAWFMTGVPRPLKCVDCHLPHNNTANHLLWKGINGTWDLVSFHSGLFSEPMRLGNHGKKTVQGNCVRCHEGTLLMVSTEGRNCWDCHRRMRHTYPSMAGDFTGERTGL